MITRFRDGMMGKEEKKKKIPDEIPIIWVNILLSLRDI
jgi:hypothetical protein